MTHSREVFTVDEKSQWPDAFLGQYANDDVRFTNVTVRIGFESLAASVVHLYAYAAVFIFGHADKAKAMAGRLRDVIANPMNPTGLWLEPAHLRALLDAQHEDSVLCLDEAYTEYARGDDYQSAMELLAEHRKPLLILRTFSKAHGLAGLRIGYGVANDAELKRGMDLVRTPFNANAVGQAAATASLHAPESVDRAVVETLRERDRMGHALTSMGLRVLPSKGNFLFVDTGRPSTDVAAALLDRAVIVKPWKQDGFETFLRVSVGLGWENDQFLEAMARIV